MQTDSFGHKTMLAPEFATRKWCFLKINLQQAAEANSAEQGNSSLVRCAWARKPKHVSPGSRSIPGSLTRRSKTQFQPKTWTSTPSPKEGPGEPGSRAESKTGPEREMDTSSKWMRGAAPFSPKGSRHQKNITSVFQPSHRNDQDGTTDNTYPANTHPLGVLDRRTRSRTSPALSTSVKKVDAR